MRNAVAALGAAVSLIVFAVPCAALPPGPPAAGAERLSRIERRIARYAGAHAAEAGVLLERLVRIPSATLNIEGVRRVGEVFRPEFEALGFTTRWIEMPAEMKRAGHFFAERRGSRGKRLLLIGHLDTVLEGQPIARESLILRGAGSEDMKGGDIVLLYALKALHEAGALEETQIIVALTGDEEDAGEPLELARRDLIDAARRSDVALAFEGAFESTGTVARRGSSKWTLRVSGVTAHSSGIFDSETGSGAVFEAARILATFHEELRGETYLTFNPSVIVGGTDVEYDDEKKRGTAAGKPNVVAQRAIVEGDLRFISEEQKENARTRMRAIVARGWPRTTAEITFEDNYPAMSPRPGNYALLGVLDQASRDLGYAAVTALDPGQRGAGDISFVSSFVDGLDGLGAMGDGGHTPDEHADLASLPMLIQRAALLIYRLTRASEKQQ